MKNIIARENLIGTLQVLDLDALLLAVSGEVNLALLFKRELASRGLSAEGKWIGFDAAYDAHFDERELADMEIEAVEEMLRARKSGARDEEKSATARVSCIRNSQLRKLAARQLADKEARCSAAREAVESTKASIGARPARVAVKTYRAVLEGQACRVTVPE